MTESPEALEALLSTLRKHGVKHYECGASGAVRVEFFAFLSQQERPSRPAGPVLAGLVPEPLPTPTEDGAPADDVTPGDVMSTGRAASRSMFGDMDKSNPLFRHVPPEVLK